MTDYTAVTITFIVYLYCLYYGSKPYRPSHGRYGGNGRADHRHAVWGCGVK